MDPSGRRRMRKLRWALVAFCLHIPVLIFLLSLGAGGERGSDAEQLAPWIFLFIGLVVPGAIAVLVFLQEVGNNARLSSSAKKRWRFWIAVVPYALLAYWWTHGGERARDQLGGADRSDAGLV